MRIPTPVGLCSIKEGAEKGSGNVWYKKIALMAGKKAEGGTIMEGTTPEVRRLIAPPGATTIQRKRARSRSC